MEQPVIGTKQYSLIIDNLINGSWLIFQPLWSSVNYVTRRGGGIPAETNSGRQPGVREDILGSM
jgi:hypothetical protein